MNIYNLHSNPETLAGFDQRAEVPEILEELVYTKQEPAIEQKIMQDPYWAYRYARDVLEERWPEAEPVIMKDPKSAYLYARSFFKGVGWPEAEKYIIKDPWSAFEYAKDVLEERWPAAEKDIMKDARWWNRYTQEFPDAER